jgi:nucleoside-diphosphate-sugar epimerase
MSLKVGLTGATGFAGPFVLAELLRAGHQINALVRRPRAFEGAVTSIQGSLDEPASLGPLVEGMDVVVHVAGAISSINENNYFRINFAGTRALYEAVVAAGVKRFVFISTLAARQPDISAYAGSKRAAEDFLLSRNDGIEILILRPSAVYGPGDKATLPLIKTLQSPVAFVPGRSKARFSLIHAADLGAVIASAATARETGLFEIDDGAGGYDWAALAAANAGITGRPSKLVFMPKALALGGAFAIECFAALNGGAAMANRGKVNELYQPDWVVRGKPWAGQKFRSLDQGLRETLQWYWQAGWLKQPAIRIRSAA